LSSVMLIALLAVAVITTCRRQSGPEPEPTSDEIPPAQNREADPVEEAAGLLAARQVSAENMISRPQPAVAAAPTGNIAAVSATETSGENVPKPNRETAPTSQLAHRYVQPSAMVSFMEEGASVTNLIPEDTRGVDLLSDQRGFSEMTAGAYIKKSAMLSKATENFSANWISYPSREKPPGFISESAAIDESDIKLKIPGMPVDNPDVLARAMYYIREAEIKMKEGDNEQAMMLYTQALAVFPHMTYANKQMGRLSLLRGEYDNAIRFLKDALDADETLSDTLNDLGMAYLYAGRGEDALKTFSASLEASPLSLDPLFNVGLALRTLDRREEARAKFEEYLDVDKFDARVYRELAVIDMQEGDQDEALSRLHTAIALDGRWYTPQLDAAIIYAEKGANIKAMEMLEKALEFAPVWVVYQVYRLPAFAEARLIPESQQFEAALADKARSGI